jgi:flagellar export protein FliJ
MKFKFPYDNLLKNKKIGRDVAYRNFADAETELQSEQSTLHDYKSDVTDSRLLNQELAQRGRLERDQLEMLKWTQQFLDGQNIKITRQQEVIKNKQIIVEEKVEALADAAKEMKIFEKLRERMKEKFKKAQKKHELKTVDEIVVMRAARSTNGFGK